MLGKISDFIFDYIDRHKHPVNALLHVVGVPMAFYGFFQLFVAGWTKGLALVTGGYLLQYLGHRAQGNEVGEVTLIKIIWRKLSGREPLSREDC